METRGEWIEREAKAARERWPHNGLNWDELCEASCDHWRNVVAPFYDLHVRATEAREEAKPDDVALTPNERNELTNLRAECEKLRTRLAATAAKSTRRRKALRQLNGAFAVMHATVSVAIDKRKQPEPREWTDADVEDLANVMRREYWKDANSDIVEGRASARAARAALGWFDGKRGEL